MIHQRLLSRTSVLSLSCFLLCGASLLAADVDGVSVSRFENRVRIEIGGRHFADYHYLDVSRPFLFPVIGPGGLAVTRNWPIREADNEEEDHPHHRSLWYAHGDINGHDFWSESNRAGRTRHVRFLELASGKDAGVIKTLNQLVARDGTIIATDERTIRIHNRTQDRILDYDITVHASHGPLTFGDTKEGSMAIRLAETMRLKPNEYNRGKPTGRIVTSAGDQDGAAWGKRAAWVDYYGPVEGKTVGVAIFDHPDNPRHPTWWHVRDYGLFAANPFGIHDFEKKPAGTGDLKLAEGEKITFRYRFYIHAGETDAAKVAERYQEYAGAAKN